MRLFPSHPRPAPGMGLAEALAVLVAVKGAQFVMLVIAAYADEYWDTRLSERIETIAVLMLLVYWMAVRWGAQRLQTPVSTLCPLRAVPSQTWAPMLITAFGLSILMSEVAGQIDARFPGESRWFPSFFTSFSGSYLAITLIVIFVAPLAEEPLYRGLFLHGFSKRYSPAAALILTALLFGLLHEDPRRVPVPFMLGLVWGWWTLRTGSLIPCLVGHALHNGLPRVLGYLHTGFPGYNMEPDPATLMHQPFWLNAAGAVLLSFGLWRSAQVFHRLNASGG